MASNFDEARTQLRQLLPETKRSAIAEAVLKQLRKDPLSSVETLVATAKLDLTNAKA